MSIDYRINAPVSAEQFAGLLSRCSLGGRRPTDLAVLRNMLEQADLTVSAWDATELVGIARSLTDFAYCCYLSDLAVADSHQRAGIGRALLDHTAGRLPSGCKIVLLSAPQAVDYYPHIGFQPHPSAWVKPV
ncbi:GNAT family N-acetyltransferase [Neisseria shayeganii]|uniref:GNAT family N-acetyltransferase n=1 Tax=Neisseria shayeganii TaxID=607712 RepID=A0A7D7SGX9_9NEIS|nr:GNAT family N-acetyltransferase [Neisseria shayeganii]QMT39627.1 GNAT family N-acetyltransferase [Neisseria shayeganii]